jgi:hypothetical protein
MGKPKIEELYLNVFNMKNMLFALALMASIPMMLAQEVCSVYYPLQEGTKFQITTYDKGDKASAVVDYYVKEAGADWAMLAFKVSDKKGEMIAESEYEIRCQDDGIAVDFKSLGAPGIMEQYEDMEVEVSGTNLIIPNELLEGRELPDSNMLMTINMSPIKMKLTVDITNRRVSGKETVTTPAGTFDCVVLSYDFATKMGIKVSGTAKQWLAEGIGMVKQEDYNKKGKRTSWSELTAFSK